MRAHSDVVPTFWTRGTGKRLRGQKDAQILALYLMTSPHTSMCGLFHLAMPTIMHETGLTAEEVDSALAALAKEDFAHYDDEEELVWLPSAARIQIGETLAAKDNRRGALRRQLSSFGSHQFVRDFYDRYSVAFLLENLPQEKGLVRGSKAPLEGDNDVCEPPSKGSDGGEKPLARGPDPIPTPTPTPIPNQGEHEGDDPPERTVEPGDRRDTNAFEQGFTDWGAPQYGKIGRWRGWALIQSERLVSAGVDPAALERRFRAHQQSRGTTSQCWQAEAEKWVLDEEEKAKHTKKPLKPAGRRSDGLDDVEDLA